MITGVCSTHFTDKFIRAFIDQNATQGYCSYCREEKLIVAINDLARHIEECISYEYDDPYNRGAWYDPEGGNYEDSFPGVVVKWKTELIEELIESDSFDVIEELSDNFENDYWAELDSIWGPTKAEYLKGGWDAFKEIIKHKVRFLFFDSKFEKAFEDKDHESINPYVILSEVGKALIELNCFKEFQPGELNVFRARQHGINKFYESAYELGAPPANLAKANRMSPPGISMFYGAFDPTTCVNEIMNAEWKNSATTAAEFINIIPIKLVDFTSIDQIPSLFDEHNRHKRSILKFIQSFVKDLSIPVTPDERVHIDYIPTQVVTEFIRFKVGKRNKIHGIIYNSVKNEGGKCVVLFFENANVIDSINRIDIDEDHAIMMLNDTIVTTFVD